MRHLPLPNVLKPGACSGKRTRRSSDRIAGDGCAVTSPNVAAGCRKMPQNDAPQEIPRAPLLPSKKVRSWGGFRRLSTSLEGIWSPRVYAPQEHQHPHKLFSSGLLMVKRLPKPPVYEIQKFWQLAVGQNPF